MLFQIGSARTCLRHTWVPIIADKLGVRVSYLTEEDPGYGMVVGRPDVENPLEENKDTLRVKVAAKPTEKSEIEYTHSEWSTSYMFMPGTNLTSVNGLSPSSSKTRSQKI